MRDLCKVAVAVLQPIGNALTVRLDKLVMAERTGDFYAGVVVLTHASALWTGTGVR